MSFNYISQNFEKLRQHISEYSLTQSQLAYQSVKNRVEGVRELYIKWIDVYQEYRRGFEREGLTRSLYPAARLLSTLGIGLEESFFEVIQSRMPVELYLLLENYSNRFQSRSKFVLAEGGGFESETVYGEISQELDKLGAPRPVGTRAETYLASIKDNDYTKIYYESGTYDSPLTWPLLLHEVFHEVYERERLQSVLGIADESWIPEVVIDLYAAIFFGPVYAVSLSKYHERFPGGGGVSHPHQGPRLFALLQFLTEMVDTKHEFPVEVQTIISKAFELTSKIWSSYRTQNIDLQDRVSKVYAQIKTPCTKFLESKKLQSFAGFAKAKLNDDAIGFKDVISFIDLGIPTSSDPRMLFNAMLLEDSEPHPLYVVESLKRWYLEGFWSRSEQAIAGTLFSR